jgi:hypothetical protein
MIPTRPDGRHVQESPPLSELTREGGEMDQAKFARYSAMRM